MKLLTVIFSITLIAGILNAENETYPEVTAFAATLKDVRWELRGTFGLKGIRYDGSAMREMKTNGSEGAVFESAVVDVGVVRLNFRGANTGWYLFSDDLRFVTPLTVSGEVAFKLTPDAKPKAVQSFPNDVNGVVFESVSDERQLQPAKLRWTGSQLEIGKQNEDKSWTVDKFKPLLANRRVFETEVNGEPVWFAFSADGTEAWLLQIENIFGGEVSKSPRQVTGNAISGLTAQQNELLSHSETLAAEGETVRAATLARHLKRLLAKKPDLLKVVEGRLSKIH